MTSINRVQSGQTGDLGTEYDVQWNRYKKRARSMGYTDFKSSLFCSGTDGNSVLQRIENHIEGDDTLGDGNNANLVSWDKYLQSESNKNDILFENKDDSLFTNIDFTKGQYAVYDEQGFTEKLGMSWENGKPYDVFEVNQNKINFYDFVFGGVSDGKQTDATFNLSECDNAKWGLQNYTIREVDTSYWGKVENTDNYESILSHDTLKTIKQAMPQWMTSEIKTQLSKYEEGSTEYWSKYYELAIKLMDQEGIYSGQYK
ncbi:MAG: hypothetical protein PHV37_02600 [Candidatus Gastranaerophilales bacterium]|nr:hypothetical protein [Candidatus Gastranaerophilales bacterium]